MTLMDGSNLWHVWAAVDATEGWDDVEVRKDVLLQIVHEWDHKARQMVGDMFA